MYLISIFLDISHSLFCVVDGHFLFQFEIAVIVVNTYYYLRGKGGGWEKGRRERGGKKTSCQAEYCKPLLSTPLLPQFSSPYLLSQLPHVPKQIDVSTVEEIKTPHCIYLVHPLCSTHSLLLLLTAGGTIRIIPTQLERRNTRRLQRRDQ